MGSSIWLRHVPHLTGSLGYKIPIALHLCGSFAVDADDVGTTDFELSQERKDLLIRKWAIGR
jgi:hypothetical protein